MHREGGRVVVHHGHLIAVVRVSLIGCAFLLAVGCSGTRSEAPKEEKEQGRTEATNTEQGHSGEATASEEEARCQGTRTFTLRDSRPLGVVLRGTYTTNDVPGCPNKGGLIAGTDKPDKLAGKEGEDEIRGLGGRDELLGGPRSDVLYGGREVDFLYADDGDDVLYGGDDGDKQGLYGGPGEDVIYGGDGDDFIDALDRIGPHREVEQQDDIYCGEGRDTYLADKVDYVSGSCEKKQKMVGGGA